MKITLKDQKASSIYYEGKFYDTRKELDLPFSDAFRLTRVSDTDCEYDIATYDPALWKEKHFINFLGDIDNNSGFGNCSYNLIKYSSPKLQTALAGRVFGVSEQFIFKAQNLPINQSGAMIWHDQPREKWLYTPFKKNICIIPFETTVIPKSWIGKINSFDVLFTLCKQNIEAFRNSGVTIPIELIHWGVDIGKFQEIPRPDRDIFTFGTMGALSIRKGTDVLIDAFKEEFPTEKDVKLICKTSYNYYPFTVNDKRIEVQMTPVTNEELMEQFFKQIDCFAFPTRGEGFGLTPLEAMATGVPVIVTGWSGPMEYMTPEVGWTIDYTFSPAKIFTDQIYKEECGDWAEPSKEHLRKLMRYAYEHRDEVKEKGRIAAQYVRDHWTWEKKIMMYLDALEKHL